jgi:hypothetical protein
MAGEVTVEVDTKQFRRAIGELSQVSGATYSETMKKAGIGPVIKKLAKDKRAKPPSVKAIRGDVEWRAKQSFRSPDGRIVETSKGKMFYRRHKGAHWRLVYAAGGAKGWHLGQDEWGRVQAVLKARKKHIVAETKRIKQRRGLLRMSFIQMADALGINLSEVGGGALSEKIPRRAKMPGRLGRASERSEGQEWEATLRNFANGLRGEDGSYWARRLQSALNSRAAAIETDMEKRVFEDFRLRASRYPGLFVERS